MMAVWQPVSNLRDYISQNPPVVTFFLCLWILAVSFICLSSYSYTHTLPNPDITKDWNHLLSSLSRFKLCVKANVSSAELTSPAPSPHTEQEVDGETTAAATEAPSVTSLRVKVPLVLTPAGNTGPLKDLDLYATLSASQLQLGGNASVGVTLEVPSSENDSYTCLTIKAPTDLVPRSPLPPECPAREKVVSPLHVEASEQQPAVSQTCYSLHSQHDPALTVMLTQAEQRVAGQHLMEVSVCLLGACLLMCSCASLTPSSTRRNHWNGLDPQNEPLMDP